MTATPRRKGFTIVEMLVVIGVITLLLGLLLPAISGVQKRGRKAEETNRIRQVGIAWDLYAQANDDAALPGYLDPTPGPDGKNVPEAWRVTERFEFPDREKVPVEEIGPYPWRLMPFLDFDQDTLIGYLDLEQKTEFEKQAMGEYAAAYFDELVDGQALPRPQTIARHPAFGYNAFYVGGWWDQWSETFAYDENGQEIFVGYRTQPRFYEARKVTQDPRADWEATGVVSRSPSSIKNSSQLVVFCSTASFSLGQFEGIENVWPGAHFAVPPFLAEDEVWRRASASDQLLDVLGIVSGQERTPIPVGRFTRQVAAVHADLHTEPYAPGDLDDQRFWIDVADAKLFLHSEGD